MSMRIEFNDIMNKFNMGLITRKQVLGLVSCGLIAFDDYREITDEQRRPIRNKPRTDLYELNRQRIPKTVDRVRSSDDDWYDWCDLLENGTLVFGSEQGNYSGGETLAYFFSKYYPNALPGEYIYDEFVPDAYWVAVVRELKCIRADKPEYYQKISDMCKRNGCGTVLGLMQKIEEGVL